ncbi:ABC transporter permease subunit [Peribacillus deserti]|uniref:ABC transmembrane type-1 domain-containing protein n=1 Tax=Peribacillus deserti TaxID=673318 RepID=A0A2N5M141_9BACI|nr:ABC transporter permease subunit [Peribacillus deserti]PLT28071.1 hypothetical protein CUU66_20680 [Peribacillus deserti]
MRYLQSKRVLFGLLYLLVLIISSFSLRLFFEDGLPKPLSLLYENGKVVGKPPFSPIDVPPLGSDMVGRNIFFLILDGAKYTILLVLFISFMRLLLGLIFGIVYAYWLVPYKKWFNGVFQIFYYVPTVLLAYIMLSPIDFIDGVSPGQYISYQVFILIVVAILPISVMLGEQIHIQLQEDYITASKLMGASRSWLLFKQLKPYLLPRMMVFFMEQVVQVLSLFAQIAVLSIFLGGRELVALEQGVNEFISLSNEWSGLVGKGYYRISLAPWVVIAPLLFFAITIISCNLIIKGLEEKM